MSRTRPLLLAAGLLALLGSGIVQPVLAQSPGTATALSVALPGAGHLYAGEGLTGIELLAGFGTALSIAIATNPGTWEEKSEGGPFSGLSEGTGTTTKLLFWGSALSAGAIWLYGVIDAPRAVRRQLTFLPTATQDGIMLAAQIRF